MLRYGGIDGFGCAGADVSCDLFGSRCCETKLRTDS